MKMNDWNDPESSCDDDDDREIGQDMRKPDPPKDEQPMNDLPNQEEAKDEPEQTLERGQNQDNQGYRERPQRDRQDRGGYNKNRKQGGYNNNRGNRDKWDHNKNEDDAPGDEQEGGYQRHNRGNKRDYQHRKPHREHFDQSEIDQNSNYRQYYCNDPEFFMKVLGQEPAPYHFKMHAFPNKKHRSHDEKEISEHQMRVDSEMAIGKILEQYTNDIRHQKIADGDKTRYNFTIEDQKKAQDCFSHISKNNTVCEGRVSLRIFYVKQESVFMKYADIEAEAYLKHQEELKKQKEEREAQRREKQQQDRDRPKKDKPFQRDNNKNNKRHNDNPDQPVDDLQAVEEKTGINFSKGPQQFTRTKPKYNDEQHQIIQDKEVNLSGKPVDGSHRTITDNTKKPAGDQQAQQTEQKPIEKAAVDEEQKVQQQPHQGKQRYNKGDRDDHHNKEGGKHHHQNQRGGDRRHKHRGDRQQYNQDNQGNRDNQQQAENNGESNANNEEQKDNANNNQQADQKQERRGGRGGRGGHHRGGYRKYNDEEGGNRHYNDKQGGDKQQTQQIVYRKVKRQDTDNSQHGKDTGAGKQQPQGNQGPKNQGAPDLKKTKSTTSNTTNRFANFEDEED